MFYLAFSTYLHEMLKYHICVLSAVVYFFPSKRDLFQHILSGLSSIVIFFLVFNTYVLFSLLFCRPVYFKLNFFWVLFISCLPNNINCHWLCRLKFATIEILQTPFLWFFCYIALFHDDFILWLDYRQAFFRRTVTNLFCIWIIWPKL